MPGRLMMHFGLRKQLLIPFITTIVIIGIAGGAFSYFYGSQMTKNQLANSMAAQLKDVNSNFETYFFDAQSVVGQFTGSEMLAHPDGKEDQINRSFQDVLNANTRYQALTFATADKKAIRAPLYFYNKGYDPTREDWYRLGAENGGKSAWTNPYIDEVTKQNVVSVTKALTDHGTIKGVVKLDLYLQSIINQVKETRFGETGYTALLDTSGTYIATPRNDEVGKNVANQPFYRMIQKKSKSGMFYTRINGQPKLVCFVTNRTTGWKLVGIINKSEIAHQANLIATPSIVTVLIILVFAVLIIQFLFNRIITRLRRIQRAARVIERGDLTVSIPVEGKDELAQLTESINQMVRANKEAFGKISDVSQIISDASQTLVASAEENAASVNEISATVNEIASGASNQSKAIDENQTALQLLVDEIRKIDERSKEVLQGAELMTRTSEGGRKTVRNLHTQSRTSAETTTEIIRAVTVLEKHAGNIDQIINVLDRIARKTNLLSLNASIEAAHAGEHGKGFAVVAGEIRKLAQQTNQSLKEVTESVNAMNEETKHAVEQAEKTSKMVQAQEEAVNETNTAFEQINETIAANVRGIHLIADAIRKTDAHIESISQGSQTVASTSEETAASTEEVSASVEEQTAAMEELNKLAENLEQQAQTMREAIRQFKIK
ncbi:methyl-accepting chemotaxis protein [Sporolactobacillus sp. THM7-4]|nr:methyl-accepting chemotaxis protein [Sporolactobacillus sp. THM7-4]